MRLVFLVFVLLNNYSSGKVLDQSQQLQQCGSAETQEEEIHEEVTLMISCWRLLTEDYSHF